MEEYLTSAVHSALSYYDYSSAIFLAHKLCSYVEKAPLEHRVSAQLLLGRVYMQQQKYTLTLKVLADCDCEESIYLQAQCNVALNRFSEAELLLTPLIPRIETLMQLARESSLSTLTCPVTNMSLRVSSVTKTHPILLAHTHRLLAICKHRTARTHTAAQHLVDCLKQDSSVWSAWSLLCDVGGPDISDDVVFQPSHTHTPTLSHAHTYTHTHTHAPTHTHTHTHGSNVHPMAFTPPSSAHLVTPSRTHPDTTVCLSPTDDREHREQGDGKMDEYDDDIRTPLAPSHTHTHTPHTHTSTHSFTSPLASSSRYKYSNNTNTNTNTSVGSVSVCSEDDMTPHTRTHSNNTNTPNTHNTNTPVYGLSINGAPLHPAPKKQRSRQSNSSSIGEVVCIQRSGIDEVRVLSYYDHQQLYLPLQQQQQPPSMTHIQTSLSTGLASLRGLARATRHTAQYQLSETRSLLSTLPVWLSSAPHTLVLQARTLFEEAKYIHSASVYARLRSLYPWWTVGVDLYSTALWHCDRRDELTTLAQDVSRLDSTSAECFVVVGNCLSLNLNHDSALKTFIQATKVDPYYAYAHTLKAYEYLSAKDTDKAVTAFRNAVAINPRHYNAWFGLGKSFMSQGRTDQAVYHLHMAATIHPRNPVVLTTLASALDQAGQGVKALKCVDKALTVDRMNTVASYLKAQLLTKHNNYHAAVQVLLPLIEQYPKESAAHYLIGQLYHKTGRHDLALKFLASALHLSNGDRKVKLALDRVSRHDDDYDVDAI